MVEWIIVAFIAAILLPVEAYLVMKLGAAGFFRAKSLFNGKQKTKGKNNEQKSK